jgi:ADP-ribose pyrophosphatase YjhB (NUDIX family)
VVLPKGHIEPGESPAETAVREVGKADVWARVRAKLEPFEFVENSGDGVYPALPHEWLAPKTKREMKKEREEATEPKRRCDWVTYAEALGRVPEESLAPIKLAEKTRLQLIELENAR